MTTNWEKIRIDFPILNRTVNDQPLIYMDNAATTQKPKQVIQAISHFYENYNSNVYRGVHTLSGEATQVYEDSRQKVANFIHARQKEEIIFTKGTTASINHLAQMLASEVAAGDEILLTYMEHHSNIIPWQQLAQKVKAKLVYVDITDDGKINLEDYKNKLNKKTKIVSFTHVSNILGTINPVQEMTKLAHEKKAIVIVDGAQAVPHFPVNMQELNVDYYAFSGHKMLGPTGIGVLYGKKEWLEKLEPAEFGGEMIELVKEEESTWASLPNKFEAGTPDISGAIGLGAAIDYLEAIGMENIKKHEEDLLVYLYKKLIKIDGLEIYGPRNLQDHSGVVSFNLQGIHPHDLATALDLEGIAIRAGHHCGQLLMRQLDVVATSRISLYFYNTKEEVDQLIQALEKAKEFFIS
ncbi:cysteine desulfurase / selenocysteine lyase [Atopostipes suicloacalis DSM 15692]|uniref:Cysteine desulfurase n=1 Tax=Atopostipes suicloacalis DSM 15692 TaxID=1121025 RepID=A0A1M4URS0_9LACT|nr:cysteine desulfurase [Atopostipes suicloacalis]SHE59394.1 cysteine desulfurase / selenocysteine lyase [Atopostipes suicloacalis DSM 15692]